MRTVDSKTFVTDVTDQTNQTRGTQSSVRARLVLNVGTIYVRELVLMHSMNPYINSTYLIVGTRSNIYIFFL